MLKKSLIALSLSLCFSPLGQAKVLYKDDDTVVNSRGYLSIAYFDSEASNEITDSMSRIGFSFKSQIQGGWKAGATFEWATNFNKNDNIVFSRGGDSNGPSGSSGDSLTARHGFIQLEHEKWGTITAGKQWAAFYDVTGATDLLHFFGGNAAGSFNVGTDGGLSGTGRVEQAIIWRKSYQNFDLSLQFQAQDEAIEFNSTDSELDGMELGTIGNGYGVTAAYNYEKFRFAAGINVVDIDINAAFNDGISGDTEDEAIGFNVLYGNKHEPGFYGALTFVTAENHEVDNNGDYFDSDGMELLLWYNFNNPVGVYGGFNHLEPDDSDNEYELHYNFVGAEYRFDKGMGMLFIETKFHDTTQADGSEIDDTDIVAGVKVFL